MYPYHCLLCPSTQAQFAFYRKWRCTGKLKGIALQKKCAINAPSKTVVYHEWAVFIPSQLRYSLKMTRRGVRRDPNGCEREGEKDLFYNDLFWHQPSLIYISLSPSVRFLRTINHADKVGCSCDAENVPPLCQIKTDMAAQGKVQYKLTETCATNRQWQVLRRVVIFVVIACYLREGREDWTQGWRERGWERAEEKKEDSEY